MTNFSRRYRDYLSSPRMAQPPAGDPELEIQDETRIAEMSDGTWHAIWQGKSGLLGEFDGGKQEAIEWARQRSPRSWIYTRAVGDYVRLDPDEDASRE